MTKLRADLHNHLITSSNLQPEDFNRTIDLAAERLGKYGIFALANFSDKRYERFIGLRGYERQYLGDNHNAILVPEKKIFVVKAQEVPTKRGHLLVLGLGFEQHIRQNQDLEDTIRETDEKSEGEAIKIADHPFFMAGIGHYLEYLPELVHCFDAFEINGEAAWGNRKARRFYEKVKPHNPQLGLVCSSDGHSSHELGKSWTELDIEIPGMYTDEFLPRLKQAVNSTNLQTPSQTHVSYAGAIMHLIKLGLITQVAPRIGLGKMFETERPEE